MPAVHARKDKMIAGLTGGIEMLFKKNKIDWIKGTARLTGGKGVEVTLHDGEQADAHGDARSSSSPPDRRRAACRASSVDGKTIIFSDEAIHLPTVPKSIAIMGSGAVGVEFASIFKSYGSEVTVIELLPRLVPGEDEAVSAELERTFKKRGIKVLTGTKVTSAKAGAKGVDLEMTAGDGKTQKLTRRRAARRHRPRPRHRRPRRRRSSASRWIAATSSSISCSRPACPASPRSATSSRWAARTTSSRTCRRWKASLLAERIAGHDRAADQLRPRAALHLLRSRDRQRRPDRGAGQGSRATTCASARSRSGRSARARMAGETDGFVKIVAEKKYDEVLGVHIIGPRATELVAEAVLALRLECTVEELVKTIHAHPTMSEAVGEAAHAAHGAAIHI